MLGFGMEMSVTTEAVTLPDHIRHRVSSYAMHRRIPYDAALAELVTLGLNAARPEFPPTFAPTYPGGPTPSTSVGGTDFSQSLGPNAP
jgi:hypothetical protein